MSEEQTKFRCKDEELMSDDSVIVVEPEIHAETRIQTSESASFQGNSETFLTERDVDRSKGLVVVSVLLRGFKIKVEEAELLASTMVVEEKLEAIDFMSTVLERLRGSVSYGKDDGTVIGCDQESNVELRDGDAYLNDAETKSSIQCFSKSARETGDNEGTVLTSATASESTNIRNEESSAYDSVNYNLFPADIKKEIVEVKSEFPYLLSQEYAGDNDCDTDDRNGYDVKGDLTNLFWYHMPLAKIGCNGVMYRALSTAGQQGSAAFVGNCRSGETGDMQQLRRAKHALRMRKRRALESMEARQRRLQLNAARNRLKRANETPEFRERRRAMQAQRMRERRLRELSEAPEMNQVRREIRARRMREHRARLKNEMPELVKFRRERDARRMRERRAREMLEAPELIQLRRAIQARQARERRANETPQERELRQQRDAARKRVKRAAQKEAKWFSVENFPPEMRHGGQLIINGPSVSLFDIGQMSVRL